jgi:CRISPR-associated protein Csx10
MPQTIRLRLQIKQLSPIAFAARRGTAISFMDTLDYVPGTALRGAVAAHYLRQFGEAGDARFQDIFLNGEVLFANLYPAANAYTSYVLPATAYACKAYKETHGVIDILTRAAALRISEQSDKHKFLSGNHEQKLLDEILDCPQCKRSMHSLAGFYEAVQVLPRQPDNEDEIETHYAKVEIHKRHLTHVGINRNTQTAQEGVLYSQQVINEVWRKDESFDSKSQNKDQAVFQAQTFNGELMVSETQAEFLLTELLATGTRLRVGESRTRGLGLIEVQDCKDLPAESAEIISNRIAEFNRKLSEHNRDAQQREYIALTLQSDAVLTDAFMRPQSEIRVEDINRALSDDPEQTFIASDALQLKYFNTGGRLVQSWNMASGYPKPDDIAIAMGSIFLFEVSSGSAKELAEPLALLQQRGIGKRRSEGFGRLTVCDSFHWEEQKPWQAR